MRLLDFQKILEYVEEACCIHKVHVDSFTVGNTQALFLIKDGDNKPSDETMMKVEDCVSQEMGRRGYKIETSLINCTGVKQYYLGVEYKD